MQLLVVILRDEEILDDVLSTLVELDLRDSVVIDSRSGLEVLERDLPIFAGLRSLVPGGIEFHRTVLALIDSKPLAEATLDAIQTLDDHTASRHSVAFLVSVDRICRF